MTATRLVESAEPGSLEALVRLLNAAPRPAIVVTFVRPYADLQPRLLSAGVDLESVFFVDVTAHTSLESFRPDAFFVGSPTLLERVGVVCRKVLPRMGGHAHIVVQDHASIQTYNGADITLQFLQNLFTDASRHGCTVDVLIQHAPDDLAAVADQTVSLESIA